MTDKKLNSDHPIYPVFHCQYHFSRVHIPQIQLFRLIGAPLSNRFGTRRMLYVPFSIYLPRFYGIQSVKGVTLNEKLTRHWYIQRSYQATPYSLPALPTQHSLTGLFFQDLRLECLSLFIYWDTPHATNIHFLMCLKEWCTHHTPKLLNMELDDTQWFQVPLSIGEGGLRFCKMSLLASPADLASVA